MTLWTWCLAVAAVCIGAAGTVEVHFESKDGGFFLKQIPRSYHLASAGTAGLGGLPLTATVGQGDDQDADDAVLGAGVGGGVGAGSVLSVDRFTVFQTAEPVSVRASYGPFSTKQTVPARYIVPDPVDQLPGQDVPLNISQLGVARHLDMSGHIVRADVARDQPVLRVLFHTGGDPAARQHAARQQRVCIVLHVSVPNKPPLSAACSPDGEDGVCLAQVTIPHTWWPPLPPLPPAEEGTGATSSSGEVPVVGPAGPALGLVSGGESGGLGLGLGKTPPRKAPPRVVQLAHSVLEPRASEPGCVPRVQIQPVTPLGTATLVPARSAYRELRADDRLTILLPHAPLYPLSRMHLPVFLQPRPGEPRVAVLIVKARVKPGLRILSAEASSDQWNVSVDMNPKHTVATVTALRRPSGIEDADKDKEKTTPAMPGVTEVFSWLVEVGEDTADDDSYDGRIVWSVRYVLEGSPNNPDGSPSPLEGVDGVEAAEATPEPWTSQQPNGDVADAADAMDVLPVLVGGPEEPQADGVVVIGGAAGGAVARSRGPRSTHTHHQGHHGHHGHHQGHQAHQGHPERHQLHGELVEETRRKLVARFEVQKDDIQAVLPISKNWQLVNTAVLTGRQVSQAMKVFIVSQAGRVADVTLQSSCKTQDDSMLKVSSSCTSVYVDGSEIRGSSNGTVLVKYGTYTGMARFTVWMPQFPLEVVVQDYRLSQIKGWRVRDQDSTSSKSKRSTEDDVDAWDRPVSADRLVVEDVPNSLDHDRDRQSSCRVRFQQSPVEVYARFKAEDHDSGRESYFVSRRTLLLVTDLVQSYMRVSDPRVATLHKRVVQGRSSGRTEVQVLSPITGRVIGSKEVRVVPDKVSVSRLLVRVVSGLQLSITSDSDIENGYVAETSVTRKLTAQYQEGLLDIDIEFSDGTRTPLRDVPIEDYHLIVDSLAPDIVAFAPMGTSASLHPRVIAVRQGRGDLLKVTLLSDELCRSVTRRGKTKSITSHVPLAVATAQVEINFAASDVAQRPEFVQNDGGGVAGSSGKERKGSMSPDLRDILIGIPLQDENNHEPTVQARQHHSSGSGSGGGIVGSIGHSMGPRHHGNVHTTPLEIGMYVLLAAFCFAIVVFVVSCVVYASKFSPQTLDQMGVGPTPPQGACLGMPLPRGPQGMAGMTGLGMAMVKRQLQPQSRDSTTNVHDWVWLGRATLERGASPGHLAPASSAASATTNSSARCGPPLNINHNPVIHITTNPNYADPSDVTEEMELAIAECLSKPEKEVERERAASAEPAVTPRVDSSTYCKKDKDRDRDRDRERARRGEREKRHHHHRSHKSSPPLEDDEDGDSWKLTPPPPPLPAHGSSPEKRVHITKEEDPDYKPPVPPHRNIPQLKDEEPPIQPRRHHHHHNHHHRNNINNQCSKMNKSSDKDQALHSAEEEDDLPDPTFVEFPDTTPGPPQGQGVSAEVKRANIVGNPMFSSTEEEDEEDDEEDQGEVQRVREELLGLDDLNMDYDQIMEYFDNLKESNA